MMFRCPHCFTEVEQIEDEPINCPNHPDAVLELMDQPNGD